MSFSWDAFRGRYSTGRFVVSAQPWWDPRARKHARTAAAVLKHELG